jgi:hypothetical protein
MVYTVVQYSTVHSVVDYQVYGYCIVNEMSRVRTHFVLTGEGLRVM